MKPIFYLALLGFLLCGWNPTRADLADELNAPGDAPQMRGLGVGGHFGRMPNWDIDKLIPLLKEMGVQVVRDEWGWEGVEKEKGVYAMPPSGDHKFEVLNANGFKILCALDYGNKLYANPLDPDAFANYAAWMAKTYKGKVAAWEIWNEPDNFYFFKQYGGPRDGSNHSLWVTKHSELIRKAAAAIKQVDPDAIVLHNMEGESWLNALKDHATDYAQTDGVDLHPYPTHLPTEGVEGTGADHNLIKTLDDNSNIWPMKYLNRRLQCWIGESGFSTYEPKDPKKVHFAPVDEALQAAGQIRTVLIGLNYGVKAWCIYDFVNESADPHDVESNFGLVKDSTNNYQPKLAFYALKRLARLLGPDWKALSGKAGVQSVIHASVIVQFPEEAGANPWLKQNLAQMYWFTGPGNHLVTIVWKAGRPDVGSAPVLGKIVWPNNAAHATAEAVDLVTGKSIPVKQSNEGRTSTLSNVPFGWNPVAIRWTPSGAMTRFTSRQKISLIP